MSKNVLSQSNWRIPKSAISQEKIDESTWFIPVDTGRKLNVHKTSWTSSERLMYVQFTSCVDGDGKQIKIEET